jgi:multidrug transporter EmrE-like cation transporter
LDRGGEATFKALSDITGVVCKDFFLEAGIEAGTEVGIGVMETVETVGFDRKEGFEAGTTFKGLSDIIGCTKGFFSRAGIEVGIGTATGVFRAIGIAGILEIAAVIARTVEIGAADDAGSSCAGHGKREGRLFPMPQQLWNPFLHASDPLIVPLLYVRPFINPFPCHALLSYLLSH